MSFIGKFAVLFDSGSKVFYEERYSNYISYYGLCTYFND